MLTTKDSSRSNVVATAHEFDEAANLVVLIELERLMPAAYQQLSTNTRAQDEGSPPDPSSERRRLSSIAASDLTKMLLSLGLVVRRQLTRCNRLRESSPSPSNGRVSPQRARVSTKVVLSCVKPFVD